MPCSLLVVQEKIFIYSMINNFQSALRSTFFCFLVCCGLLLSCVNATVAQQMEYREISLMAETRGYSKTIVFTQDELTITEQGTVNSSIIKKLQPEQVLAIKRALAALDSEALKADFEVADALAADAALMYSLQLDTAKEELETDYFALEDPPAVLKDLITTLLEIEAALFKD